MSELAQKPHVFLDGLKYPSVFFTVSGAHLYGFPSADSDYDLRGIHVLPIESIAGLDTGPDTIEITEHRNGLDADVVCHDVKKFFLMLLRRNGYVLEQLTSPLKVVTSSEHDELLSLVPSLLTRQHSHHYLGFAQTQWNLFNKEEHKRVKPLLYTFRVLLTGIHLMRSGKVEANLPNLNAEFRLPYLEDLIEKKVAGKEKGELPRRDFSLYVKEYERLVGMLEAAAVATSLPDRPSARPALHDLLVRVRKKYQLSSVFPE